VRTQIKYTAYRDKSLAERKELGVGNSDEMNTLFRFWCVFATQAVQNRPSQHQTDTTRVVSKAAAHTCAPAAVVAYWSTGAFTGALRGLSPPPQELLLKREFQ